jgi:hypothetical protein
MPNWCVNQVDIQGDEAEVAKLVALVKSEDSVFSFEKIVPPPDTDAYRGVASSSDYLCGCKSEYVDGVWTINGKALVGRTCPEHLAIAVLDSPDNWYNWNIEHWGTKWSAAEGWNDRADSEEIVEGKTSYNFDTAWSPAEPVVAALAEQFPTLTMQHRYCEAGMGFAGEIAYVDGKQVSFEEYDMGDSLPDVAWLKDEKGEPMYGERDYVRVPMNAMERFCDEHFGGVVGG